MLIQWIRLAGVGALALAAGMARGEDLGASVVIVYNEQEPESRPLADYYAQKRGVPTNQICSISLRPVETITRAEFLEGIRQPVLRFLQRQGLLRQQVVMIQDPVLGRVPSLATVQSRVSYLVLMYGVPLRIEADPSLVESNVARQLPEELRRNEASVDSELTTIPTMNVPTVGPLPNPFYESRESRFGAPLNRQMLLVGRLDGPDPQTVRRMIDDAVATEKHGLWGRAIVDARGIQEKGYVEGDEWLFHTERLLRKAGFECDFDTAPEVLGEDVMESDVALYAGWYAEHICGPFRREGFRFRTGAFAYHIHSWSATSLRTRQSNWVGPLLDRGAAASLGTVYEPYLSLSPHVDKFFQRWLEGAPFLEAAYYSQSHVSWQTTFVGDPLYRPFARPLEEQIAALKSQRSPDVAWAYLCKVNRLAEEGRSEEAEALCRDQAETWNSPVLFEKWGDLLRAAHRNREALRAYQRALRGDSAFGSPSRWLTQKMREPLSSESDTKPTNGNPR